MWVHVRICVWVCMCACMFVHVQVHVHMWRIEGDLRPHPQRCHPPPLRQCFSLAWSSLARLSYASEDAVTATSLASAGHHVQLFTQVLGVKLRFPSLWDKCLPGWVTLLILSSFWLWNLWATFSIPHWSNTTTLLDLYYVMCLRFLKPVSFSWYISVSLSVFNVSIYIDAETENKSCPNVLM